MRKTFFLWILLLVCLPAGRAFTLDFPRMTGYINDRAGMISPGVDLKLENFLRGFERSDSTQIAVLTIPSLKGEALEEYALQVAETWGLGQKGKDNGVLLLVVRDDHKIRIEVGYGLEGKLTDLLTGRIIDNEITPYFRQGNFDGGIIAGVSALASAVRGQYQGDGRAPAEKRRSPWGALAFLLFLGPSLLRFTSVGRRGRGYRRGSGLFWIGGPFGGGGGFGGGFSGGGGGGFGGGGASGGW